MFHFILLLNLDVYWGVSISLDSDCISEMEIRRIFGQPQEGIITIVKLKKTQFRILNKKRYG